jgi:hypothetical protein
MQTEHQHVGAQQTISVLALGLLTSMSGLSAAYSYGHSAHASRHLVNTEHQIFGAYSTNAEINGQIAALSASDIDFVSQLGAIYEGILSIQKPLDADIARALAKHLSALYVE